MVGLWIIAFVTTIVGGILTMRDHKRAQEERMVLLQDQRRIMMDHLAETLDLSQEECQLFAVLQSAQMVSYADIEALGLSREDARAVLITLQAKVAPLGLKVVAVLETGYVLVKES